MISIVVEDLLALWILKDDTVMKSDLSVLQVCAFKMCSNSVGFLKKSCDINLGAIILNP